MCWTGDFIDNIHRRWSTDYKKLERNHGYIQWFVLRVVSDNTNTLQVIFLVI